MRKLLPMSILAGAALAAAGCTQFTPHRGPGHHDPYGYDRAGYGERDLPGQINRLHQDIHRETERGSLSPRAAARLNYEVDRLQNRYARYSRNGISRDEHFDLQQRIDRAYAMLQREVRDYRRY